MNRKKVVVTLSVLVAMAAGIVGTRFVSDKIYPPIQRMSDAAKTRGNPRARFKIVEYTDFQCPSCANGAKELDVIMKSRPDDFFLEYRSYPLSMRHQHAFKAAILAECAARQGKFWPFHDLVFQRQKEWAAKADAEDDFQKIAAEAGLDIPALNACRQDPTVAQVIQHAQEEGDSRDVQATPTYFLNGKIVVGIKRLQEVLNSAAK